MTFEGRLASLMLIWQESVKRGAEPDVTALCRDCPELIGELERRISVLRRMKVSELDSSSRQNTSDVQQTVLSDQPPAFEITRAGAVRPAGKTPAIPGYELLDELGRGGMGVVYLARDLNLQRVVALKVVLSGEYASAAVLNRFQKEVESVAQLQHPGVVQIYEVGNAAGIPYCTLEYCNAGSLAALLRQGPLPAKVAAELVGQLANTMHVVHSHGIIHRDLKPGNILLQRSLDSSTTSAGQPALPPANGSSGVSGWCLPGGLIPKISDFGLARRLDRHDGQTLTGEVVGTPAYMAPEQAAGRPDRIGPATDVHALGVILYECLTSHSPFRAPSFADTMELVQRRDAVSPRNLLPSIPRDLDTICLKCLNKDPAKRYASARELSDDIQRFLNHEVINARRAGLFERCGKWVHRHPTTATTISLLAIALATILGMAFWFSIRIGEQRSAVHIAQLKAASNQELAETQEFHALFIKLRQRRSDPMPGWKWENLLDLKHAAQMKLASERRLELRNEAIATLSSVDVRLEDVVAKGFTAANAIWDTAGQFIALGERRDVMFMVDPVVRFIESQSGEKIRELGFPSRSFKSVSLRKGIEVEPDGARALGLSADGRTFAVGSRSGLLHVWELNSSASTVPKTIKAHTSPVSHVLFSRHGNDLFSISKDDHTICRWNLTELGNEPQAKRTLEHKIQTAAQHPTEGWLSLNTADDQFFRLDPITLADIEPPLRIPTKVIQFMPGGRSVLALADTIIISSWENLVFEKPFRDPDDPLRAQPGSVTDLAVSPDGQFIASASSEDKHVRIWEVASSRLISDFSAGGGEVGLAFSPDSRRLVVTADRQTLIYAISSAAAQSNVAAYLPTLRRFALDPSSSQLWAIGELGSREPSRREPGSKAGHLYRWGLQIERPPEISDVRALSKYSHDSFHQVAFHPSKPFAAVLAGDQIELWSTDGKAIERKTRSVRSPSECVLTWDDAGRLWVADGDEITALEVDSFVPIIQWRNLSAKASGLPQIYSLAVGGTHVVGGGRDGQAYLLNTAQSDLAARTVRLFDSPIRCASMSPDKKFVAMGSDKGKLSVIDVETAKQVIEVAPYRDLAPHRDRIETMDWSKNNMLATAGTDRMLRLSRWKEDHFEVWFEIRLHRPIRQVRFHPDGEHLFVLVDRESSIRVWNLSALHEQLRDLGLDSPSVEPFNASERGLSGPLARLGENGLTNQ